MAFERIDYGSYANDPSADNAREAFEKLDNNIDKTLEAGTFGFPEAEVSIITDLDNYTQSGLFITPSSGLTNIPGGWTQSRMFLLNSYNLTYHFQLLSNSISRNQLAFRQKSGTGWGAWNIIM